VVHVARKGLPVRYSLAFASLLAFLSVSVGLLTSALTAVE
jgi:hypothetical protein